MRLTQIIEALLFASDAPLTAADLARVDERLDEDTVTAVVDELRSEYDLTERSFQIYDMAGGYQLLTRPEFLVVLERYDTVPQSTRLSTPALEVLAIVAYRQPLGRTEIEEIRGVQSAAVLRTLQDRALIEPVGRSEALGRPLLYGTTSRFLEHFAFRSLEDLPRPDELPVVLRARSLGTPDALTGVAAAHAEDATAPVTGEVEAAAHAGPAGAEAAAGETGRGGESSGPANADEPVHAGAAAEEILATVRADAGEQAVDVTGTDEAEPAVSIREG